MQKRGNKKKWWCKKKEYVIDGKYFRRQTWENKLNKERKKRRNDWIDCCQFCWIQQKATCCFMMRAMLNRFGYFSWRVTMHIHTYKTEKPHNNRWLKKKARNGKRTYLYPIARNTKNDLWNKGNVPKMWLRSITRMFIWYLLINWWIRDHFVLS